MFRRFALPSRLLSSISMASQANLGNTTTTCDPLGGTHGLACWTAGARCRSDAPSTSERSSVNGGRLADLVQEAGERAEFLVGVIIRRHHHAANVAAGTVPPSSS